MQKEVLVTLPLKEEHKRLFQDAVNGTELVLTYKTGLGVTPEDLARVNAVIGNLPPARLRGNEQLEWVQLNSAGAAEYADVLPGPCVLTNAAGAYGPSVSEHMLALTFALIRRLGQYGRNQMQHTWKAMGQIISVEGATVAVLGLGDIGSSYARKVKALGAYVIGFRRTLREKPDYLDEQYTLDSLEKILPRVDILSMVLPGLAETEHIINAERLALMKEGAYLINVGRGNAVEAAALKEAVRSGRLGGAALDVTEPEPLPAGDELWDFDNVIITPHVAGQFFLQETFERIVRISAENLASYARGRELAHVVDRKLGY